MASLFRHRQAPHFNLRHKEAFEVDINMAAQIRKQTATQAPPHPFHTCQRERKAQTSVCSRLTNINYAPSHSLGHSNPITDNYSQQPPFLEGIIIRYIQGTTK